MLSNLDQSVLISLSPSVKPIKDHKNEHTIPKNNIFLHNYDNRGFRIILQIKLFLHNIVINTLCSKMMYWI